MTDTAEITLRPGTPADYEAALAIQRRAYALKEAPLYGDGIPPLKETPATLAAEIAAGCHLLVAERGGRVVGSLRLRVLPDGDVYFGRLSVDPDCQGRGVGQRLARGVEERFPAARRFRLNCGERSAENRHIYTKLGYRETGQREQVPGGPAVVEMVKERADAGE